MQQLKIPQSQFVTPNNMVASEWLVFLNELIRLGNLVISSDTVNKADEAEVINISQSTFVGFDVANSNSQQIDSVPLQINQKEQPSNNPYAQMSAIEQQLHDQQIWNLIV